jgi:hypothetical protein
MPNAAQMTAAQRAKNLRHKTGTIDRFAVIHCIVPAHLQQIFFRRDKSVGINRMSAQSPTLRSAKEPSAGEENHG